MIRTILKVAGGGIIALAVVVAVLYQFFGLRFVMDGGGTPHPRFMQTSDGQAERIERHREAQRAAASTPEPVEPPAAVSPAIASESVEPAAAVKPEAVASTGPAPYWTDFRGPHRDGEYREVPVLADWPTSGLAPLW